MNKTICKQIFQYIDDIEIEGIDLSTMTSELYEKMRDQPDFDLMNLNDFIDFLLHLHLLKQSISGIDLIPCAAIFVRSMHCSDLEALALFEFTLRVPHYRELFANLCEHPQAMLKEEVRDSLQNELLFQLFDDTSFFVKQNDLYTISSTLIEDMKLMIQEYEEQEVLLSTVLCAHYAHHLIFERNQNLLFKNEDRLMIRYPMQETIFAILPIRGIPKDREVTRGLQAFYKDTLFHEFDHRCPICGASIAHMLIASHIRPFRDCAHIYEAIDYHNGILLCKNHDFLFDQGYFSFLEDGQIIFSKELLQYDPSHYQLDLDFHLPQRFLTPIRKQFLEYHLQHIFRK